MGLPTRDSSAAYHTGLPKVPPPLLRIGREYAAVRKHQTVQHTIEREAAHYSPPGVPTERDVTRYSPPAVPIHRPHPHHLPHPGSQHLRTSPCMLPSTLTDDEDSSPQLSPLPLTIGSKPGSNRASPHGASPTEHIAASTPMLYPVAMPLPPELVAMTTSAGVTMATKQDSVSIFPPLNRAIPEGVLGSDVRSRNGPNEYGKNKQTRKQNMLTFGDEDKKYPPHSQERLLMRPWLMERLDYDDIPGMIWVDKAKHLFQIPWKHGSRREWEHDTDAKLFRMWAQHTGKYRPGHPGSVTDPKTWKANFRCAINSLPDVVEVKEMNVTSKRGPNAFKVYTFLPAKTRKRGTKVETKKTMHIKREQEVQKQLHMNRAENPQHGRPSQTAAAEHPEEQEHAPTTPSKPPISPPRTSPKPRAEAPNLLIQALEAPVDPLPPRTIQEHPIIAQAIASVMLENKKEESMISNNEIPKEMEKAPSDSEKNPTETHRSQITSSATITPTTPPTVASLPKPNATGTTICVPTGSLSTRATFNESHIPHKKRKIMDISFPASTPVSVSQTSNLNSLLEILNSDDRQAKRRKEMEEEELKEAVDLYQTYTKNTLGVENHGVVENVNSYETMENVGVRSNEQRIPTVVFDNIKTENDSIHESQRLDNFQEQREMNVNVVVQTIPSSESDVFAMTNYHRDQQHQEDRVIEYQRVADETFGCRIHKNKEFLKRFLKDNGVRTLIKTKLDEIHRSPVYQSVLQGQPCIPSSIEGPLGQNNNTRCSVV